MANPFRISGRVEIDANPAKAGAAEASQAVSSIGNAASNSAAQIEKLNRAAGEGIRTPLGGSTGAELDRLRAKYNPLFAAIQQYKAAQLEIKTAHAAGALSADEMTAALNRNRQATLASIDAIKGRSRAIVDTPVMSTGARGFETANIAAQFQDIGVTAAMGMSPLQVALQQGTQLSAILTQMQSPIRGLAAAFMSVISPVSLITIGTIAAATAAVQYFTSAKDGAKSADTILKGHADTVSSLKELYGQAAAGLREYVNEGVTGTAVDIRDRLQDARDLLIEAASARSTYSPMIAPFAKDTDVAVLRDWRNAFVELRKSISDGEPDILRFRSAMARIAENKDVLEGLRTLAKEMRDFKDEGVVEAARAIPGMLQQLDLIGGKAQNQVASIQALNKSLRELAGIAIPAMTEAENAHRLYVDALSKANGRTERDDVESTYRDALTRIANRNPLVINSDGNQTSVPIPSNKPVTLGDRDRSAERAASSTANAYRDLIKSADDRVAQMKLEAQLAGQTGIASDALRFKLDLLQQSEEKGRSLSAAQVAAIEKRVEAFKQYAEEAAKATLQANLLFDREQMGRSAMDQQIAGALRSSGLPVDFSSTEAGLIRTNYQLQYARDLAGDFTSTLFGGLRQGEKLFDALGDAGVKALLRVADTLINDVLNAMISVNGASSGSGGGIGGLISGIFGGLFGSGSSIGTSSTSAWATGINAFNANGGVYGAVTPFAKGGAFTNSIVNKPTLFPFAKGTGLMGEAGPEAIMPLTRDASGRLGVTATVTPLVPNGQPSAASQPMQISQPQKTAIIQVDVTGARGNQEIEDMVAAGVQRGLEQYDAVLPDRVSEIADNPRWR